MQARSLFRAIALLASTVVTFGLVTAPSSAATDDAPTPLAVEVSGNGRYLVQLAADSDVSTEAREMRENGARVRRTFTHALDAAAVTATPDEIAEIAESAQVVAIEPDPPILASETQDGATWGLDRIDQRSLPLSQTFSHPSGVGGVDVYVVDTGVLADHNELRGRVAPGHTSLDDGHGTNDCNGHGTHVAGTAAGRSVGVARAARVIPVRVLDCQGSGTGSGLLAGLDWIVAHHSTGPAVANLSLGGPANSILDQALERVIADGVVAVVAAGNSAVDACTSSPARVPAALTVAATTKLDSQASFSNHGSCVDLYAPGTQIVSAYHSSPSTYAQMSGTSMAAPHVAGAAAVILGLEPSSPPAEVAWRIASDATADVVVGATSGTPNRLLFLRSAAPAAPGPAESPTPVSGPDPTPAPATGPGAEPEPVPTKPVLTRPGRARNVTVTSSARRTASLSWRRSGTGGGLTRQIVRVYVGGKRVSAVRVSAAATSLRVAGLVPGRVYRFTVVQVNEAGPGRESRLSGRVVPRR